jgi:hypothetical protein
MKTVTLYVLLLAVFALGIWLTFEQGRKLGTPQASVSNLSSKTAIAGNLPGTEPSPSVFSTLQKNLQDPLPRLFLQLIVILLAARLAGAIAAKFRQPAVIGEMIAGILLGPSLLGWVSPDAFHFIFPASSLGSLRLLSQLGVCLFMFVVGMELNVAELRQQAKTAVLVSQVSILFPYLLGVITALFLFRPWPQEPRPFQFLRYSLVSQ